MLERLNNIWHQELTRRDFFKKCLKAGIGIGSSLYILDFFSRYKAFAAIGEKRGMREAMFYEKWGDDAVKCFLCPEGCVLRDGQRGFCRAREPVKGKLYSLVYELVCAMHIDPIEKKPMYHMLPGSRALSIAAAGCNSRCKYCQNWTISQRPPEETTNQVISCENLVLSAMRNKCASIAYTYTEPVVFYEYVLDAAKMAKKGGIYNVIVTGGKINVEPIKMMSRYVDAANFDFKGFTKKYLREVCAQDLDNILQSITTMHENGIFLELTNLIVPTLNDNMDDIRRMAKWIKSTLGPGVPLHFSRFWPQYKLRSLYPTPVATLERARDIAMEEGLHYVYIGNAPSSSAENTICPECKKVVIKRQGYLVEANNLVDGTCKFCGYKIPGIWK